MEPLDLFRNEINQHFLHTFVGFRPRVGKQADEDSMNGLVVSLARLGALIATVVKWPVEKETGVGVLRGRSGC